MAPDPRFFKFSKEDLEEGLRQMAGNPEFASDLRTALRQELIYRIENENYETDCRARKALSGGCNG